MSSGVVTYTCTFCGQSHEFNERDPHPCAASKEAYRRGEANARGYPVAPPKNVVEGVLSNCCAAFVTVGGERTTHYHVCGRCGHACDTTSLNSVVVSRLLEETREALRANQVFHTPVALRRKPSGQWDEFEQDAITRTRAALERPALDLTAQQLAQRVLPLVGELELALLAVGGEVRDSTLCTCDPSVGAVPCRYCVTRSALRHALDYFRNGKLPVCTVTASPR